MNHSVKQRPCPYVEPFIEEDGKKSHGVYCNEKCCASCGWNPAEKERRLREGQLKPGPAVTIRTYSGETDNRGQVTHYVGLTCLIFPKKNSGGKSA